jgi:hypothetical protein
MQFSLIYQTKYGNTSYHEKPKLAAYNYASRVKRNITKDITLVFNEDNSVTVKAHGLASATFAEFLTETNTEPKPID